MEVLARVHYDKHEEIGGNAGQNSKVYRCFDHHLNATLVVKEIEKARIGDAKRFFTEARAVHASAHPRVVRVHWAAETDDKVCIAMPFMPGGSLADLIHLPMRVSRLIQVGQDVCEGVAQVHIARFVHLDIKPTNILFDAFGRAAIGDFGLSLPLDFSDTADVRDLALYPSFRPPEVMVNKGIVTPAADVYQIGLTLYRAANGEPFFRRQWTAAAAKPWPSARDAIARGEFPNRSFVPSVPVRLRQIILRAIDVDPAKRHVGARALAEELAQVEVHHDWEAETQADAQAAWRLREPDHVDILVLQRGVPPDAAVEIFTESDGSGRRRTRPDAWSKNLSTDRQVTKALLRAFRAAETLRRRPESRV